MKIVFLSDAIYPYNKGGKEKRLYELSTRLAQLGHDVHIFTMHWWDSKSKVRVEDKVTLHAISKYHPLYAGNKRSVKEGILFGIATFRLLRIKYDVLDVDHMPFFPVFSAWIVCKIKRKNLFGTWHEALSLSDWTDYMGSLGVVSFLIERISIKLPNVITAASARTKKLLGTYHFRTKKVFLVTSGVDIKLINEVKPVNKSCDILYVGRLVKDKNIDVLIKAFAIVSEKNPKLSCVIIGDGPEASKLRKLIVQLKLQKRVVLLKPLDTPKEIYAYMKKSKVFVLPSIREGFGIVALESLACGTPVVTTNVAANASRELIEDLKTGSAVPLKTETFAAAIQYWLSNDKIISNTKLAESFDWEYIVSSQLRVYKGNL